MGRFDHIPQSPLAAQIAVLTVKHDRLLAGVWAVISHLDRRDDYAGLSIDETWVLNHLRAIAAEARP